MKLKPPKRYWAIFDHDSNKWVECFTGDMSNVAVALFKSETKAKKYTSESSRRYSFREFVQVPPTNKQLCDAIDRHAESFRKPKGKRK